MKQVKKRDGRIVDFDPKKIERAILAAFIDVDGEASDYAKEKAANIASYIEGYYLDVDEIPEIEDIQDLVEKGLMATKRKDVAKNYILYREERTKIRNKNSQLMKNIKEKVEASDVQNQNANVDEYSFGGRMGEARNELMKDYALNYIVSPMARENHLNNEIYIHDLDSYAVGMHNCLTIPFDKLLAEGFNTRQTDVRPAQSINTAFQLVAVLFQLQSLQQFGGVSASHIDWTMVPYVRKSFRKHWLDGIKYLTKLPNYVSESNKEIHFAISAQDKEHYVIKDNASIDDENYQLLGDVYQYAMDMTEKELMQAVQGMYHNLNTLQSRSGNQLPFTSINYGTCTLHEGRMVTKALLEGSIEGVGKVRKTPIFPCGIFQCMKGVNRKPGEPNYDLFQLALRSTAQRLYPNYVNVDWSVNAGYDPEDPKTYVSTMGCRTYNGADINAEPGTNPQTKDGRGNICPVTIVMPTLAMEAKEYYEKTLAQAGPEDTIKSLETDFMELLDKKIHEARDMLVERYNWIISQDPSSAKFMYENGVMLGYDGKTVESAMKHGTLVIGQIGLAETLQILIGKDHTTEEGMELAKRIEQLFKDRCAQFKKELHLNIGVYYTPAENMCYTSMKKFKKAYGEIPNVSDRKFFTNSIHVPVWKEMSPFEKIDIESQLTGYSNAGCITYVELEGGVKNNLDALEEIVNYAMDKDIPYFAINVPNDTCLDCGYTDEFNDKCPMCGSTHIQQLRRVTGYLTGDYKTAFNLGKQQETEMRFKHSKELKGWR
jgi:ribonucleoside-triphosphate reductase